MVRERDLPKLGEVKLSIQKDPEPASPVRSGSRQNLGSPSRKQSHDVMALLPVAILNCEASASHQKLITIITYVYSIGTVRCTELNIETSNMWVERCARRLKGRRTLVVA